MKTKKYITFIASICLAAGSIYYFEGVASDVDGYTAQQLELGFWVDQQSYANNAKSELPSFNTAKFKGQDNSSENNGFAAGSEMLSDLSIPLISQFNRPEIGNMSFSDSKNSAIPEYKRSGDELMQSGGVFLESTSYLLKNKGSYANVPTNDVNFAGNNLRDITMNHVSAPFKTLGTGNQGNEDPFNPGGGNDNPGTYNDCPVGDGTWFLMLIALIFVTYKTISFKKLKSKNI